VSTQFHLLKAKIHHATVTGGALHYQGSLTIDADLMDAVGLLPFEKILCANMAAGQRFETYAIAGPRGSGQCVLNGPTAHLGKAGDVLVIMAFAMVDADVALSWKPKVIILGANNSIVGESDI
jgi:aspartate 1-decarboxylase